MNIKLYSERLKEAAIQCGFNVSWYGKIGETALPVLERFHADDAPTVYISSGVHGDEPAAPMALLELLRRKAFPHAANYTLFPLINPTGLAAGTRENADGIDLNRDYGLRPRSAETRAHTEWLGQRQFGFTLCLHEDYDGEGFYLYAHARNGEADAYAEAAIQAAALHTGIDQRTSIDDMPAKNGRMFPPRSIMDNSRNDLPEALRLYFHHGAEVTITTETPSGQAITARIQAQCAAVEALLAIYLGMPKP